MDGKLIGEIIKLHYLLFRIQYFETELQILWKHLQHFIVMDGKLIGEIIKL